MLRIFIYGDRIVAFLNHENGCVMCLALLPLRLLLYAADRRFAELPTYSLVQQDVPTAAG